MSTRIHHRVLGPWLFVIGALSGQALVAARAPAAEPLIVLAEGAPRLDRGVTLRNFVALPNGNVLIEGQIDRVDDTPTNGLAMLGPTGRKITTLAPRCTDEPVIPGRYGCSVQFLPLRDGSFLLTAWVRETNQLPQWRISRYLADGSLDPQFRIPNVGSSRELGGPVGQSRDHVYVAHRAADGTLEVRRFSLSVPIQFDPSYLASNVAMSPTVDEDGRLFDQLVNEASNVLRRRDATGAIDGNWRADLPPNSGVYSHDPLSGRILIANRASSAAPGEIRRLTPQGTIDPEWRLSLVAGSARSTLKRLAAFQPGLILSIQTVDGTDLLVVNSTLDGRVLASRPVPSSDEFVLASGAGNSWFIGNNASQNRSPIGSPLLRLQADLSIDPNFTPRLRRPGVAFHATRAPQGGLLVAGEFSEINGAPRPKVARLNADSSVGTALPFVNHPDTVRSLSWVGIGPEGTLATAEFETRTVMPYALTIVSSNGQSWRRLRSITPSFGWRDSFGSILVGGKLYGGEFCAPSFSQSFPTGIWRVALSDALASPPASDVPTGCLREPGWGPVAAARPDGPFAVGGGFLYYSEGWFSTMRVRRIRLDADSSPDPGFLISAQSSDSYGRDAITTLAVSDGYLYLSGEFDSVNGANIPGLARINLAGGALDPDWPASRAERRKSAIAVDAYAVYRAARIDDDPPGVVRYELTRYRLPSGEASAPLVMERSAVALFAGAPWAPRVLPLGDGRVVVTGDFWRIGGVERDGFAVVGPPELVWLDGFEAER